MIYKNKLYTISILIFIFVNCFTLMSCSNTDDNLSVTDTHVHNYILSETTDVTCTKNSYNIYRCICGSEKKELCEKKLGHDIKNYKFENATLEHGERTVGVCERCGETIYSVEITGPLSPVMITVSDDYTKDDDGNIVINMKVKNRTDKYINCIYVSYIFYDTNNNILKDSIDGTILQTWKFVGPCESFCSIEINAYGYRNRLFCGKYAIYEICVVYSNGEKEYIGPELICKYVGVEKEY